MRAWQGLIGWVVLAVLIAIAPAPAQADNAEDDFAFIAVKSNDGFFYELVITNGKGHNDRLPISKPVIGRPAFSPDGTRIVFSAAVTDGTDGRWALYVANVDGTGLEQLTDPPLGDFDPAWSANGNWIAFSRNTRGNMDPATCCVIKRMRANGTHQKTVPGTLSGTNPTWDPSGSRLAYERGNAVYVTTLDGVTSYRLESNATQPDWSPNGLKIAYVRAGGGEWQVVEEKPGGGSATVRETSNHRLESPVWDIDSATLFYVRYSGEGYEGRANTTVRRDDDAAPTNLFSDTRSIIMLTHTPRPDLACDVNGDGLSDAAIGAPHDDEPGPADSGVVNVLYGSPGGLDAAGNQLWHQGSNGVAGAPGADDRFGAAIACADFDRDGFSDVAIGAPGNSGDSGEVNVLYGTASGLSGANDQRWTQDSPNIKNVAQNGDEFGSALTAGDFDGDGFADLAIGVPGEDLGVVDAGAVNVLYGSANGLAAAGNQFWKQNSAYILDSAQAGDAFGAALASGDFDRDGRDDLAVGVPFEDVGTVTDMGMVNLIYGTGGGLRATGNQRWHQDRPNVIGVGQNDDQFGSALAAGDFDRDDRDDLAVGVPFEDISDATNAGAVNVLYGASSGLSAAGNQQWTQDSAGIIGVGKANDQFGTALATGDSNGDRSGDLVVGVPGDKGTKGAINVILGSPAGLTKTGNRLWHQGSGGILGVGKRGDRFGSALAMGDYDGGGFMDIVIGVPLMQVSAATGAGVSHVIYGSALGFTPAGDQVWHQNSPDVRGVARAGDALGTAVR